MQAAIGAFVGAALGLVAQPSLAAEVKIGVAASLTGPLAFAAESDKLSTEWAVSDLNAAGGVLGEQLKIVMVDDQCDAEAAVLAAKKLAAEGVAAVFGHICSGAAIPASTIYEAAGIPMFASYAVNPKLTDRGLHYVFRLVWSSDRQAVLAADLLVARYRDRPIAIVHDTQVASIGLAAAVRKELDRRGFKEALYEELASGHVEFADLIARLRQAEVAVLYCACFTEQGSLLIRQIWETDLKLPMVASNAVGSALWVIAGAEAAQATVFADAPAWMLRSEAKSLAARARDAGVDPNAIQYQLYAGLQAWAQAVEQAKSVRGSDVVPILHEGRFNTVLGNIGFTEKGEIEGPVDWVWYRYRDGRIWELITEELLSGRVVERPAQ